jgi:hypothetical protein
MRHSSRIVSSALAVLVVAVTACKGETVIKPDPKTQSDLDQCNKDKQALTDYKKQLEASNIDLQNKAGSGSSTEIVVSIEGNALTVRPAKQGEPAHPIDDKATAAASKAFLNLVAQSRGGIQKCYEQALKKRSDLQAKTVTLIVSASFTGTGAFQSSNFQPSLGDVFDACMQSIAAKWVMPTNSPAMTFKAPVSLTPS